ncbi:hypothetical protein K439DRAFT_1615689 [Ramaria rubella]|nr:hypothetical protein K439DRAFT_1615689 [Ramaria rubella]
MYRRHWAITSLHLFFVLSTECVTEWTSPFASQHHQLLEHHFPHSHIRQTQDVMCSSVIKKTRGNWGVGILCFNQYCNSIGIPESGRMPAPEYLLCLFVANYGAGSVSDDCINSASRLVLEDSRRPPRPPVSIQHIECLRAHLDLSNTFNSVVFAITTIAFYTIPSRNSFNPSFHIARDCNITQGVAHHGRMFTTIHIPWSKTCLSKGDDLHLIDTQSSSSPITALEHHLSVNHTIPPNAPLFAWCMAHRKLGTYDQRVVYESLQWHLLRAQFANHGQS